MRLAAQLFYALVKRNDPLKFSTAGKFNFLYSINPDPFNTHGYEDAYVDQLLALLGHRRFRNVADLGCGPGILTNRLAVHCESVTAVDFSAKAIDLARKNCRERRNITFICQDISVFADAVYFDLFVCSEVLYYLDDLQFTRLLQNIQKMAEPQALALATCRLDDMRVKQKLDDAFTLVTASAEPKGSRPYVIYLYRCS